MPKVSIIIAMYNIEDYIAYCINSCVSQVDVKPEDYEIIIINDGSTDKSLEIAQESIKGVTNARIITRINGGLSVARNTGIEAAKGEYLWFVDGDDAISPNALKVLMSNIKCLSTDAYIINFSTFDGEKKLKTSNFAGSDVPLSGKEYHFSKNRILPMMAWLTIYKTEVIKRNKLFFMPNIIHEDFEFSIRAHHFSSSIQFVEEDIYLYRIGRSGSIMSESKKDQSKSLFSLYIIRDSFKTFFQDIENEFVQGVYGVCARLILTRYYHPLFWINTDAKKLVNTNKKNLYSDLWYSRKWKLRLLVLIVICMPSKIVSKLFLRLEERTKLM